MEDRFKDIIIDSLSYLSNAKRVVVYGFVIMTNHFHLIWQIPGDRKLDDVQRDFLKYTGQQILKHLRNEQSVLLDELIVNAKDRKRQIGGKFVGNSIVVARCILAKVGLHP